MKKFVSGIACVACAVALIAGCSSPSSGSGTIPQQPPVQQPVPAQIGYIAYQTANGLYDAKADYDASYGTPIGIVFELDEDGNAKQIVSLKQSPTTLQWAESENVEGYYRKFDTSTTDGSGNWQIICNNVEDEGTSGNYPAFEYCNGLTDGGKSWYLPAKNELKAVYDNREAINVAIRKLQNVTATELPSNGWFWSSSQDANYGSNAWNISFDSGYQSVNVKQTNYSVRGVADF